MSTAEELTVRLPDPVFAEATGVLEMIAKNPHERRLYNVRLKSDPIDLLSRYGCKWLNRCCGTSPFAWSKNAIVINNHRGRSVFPE